MADDRTELPDPWTRNLPSLFRALSDPALRAHLPLPVSGSLEDACASWGALHYAFNCLLGWRDIPKGLAWWYRTGKTVEESEVLALIHDVWGRDDLIDYYAAWSWKPVSKGWMFPQEFSNLGEPSPSELAKTSRWPDENWWRAFVRRGAIHHHDPFYGGSDALHLRAHTGREELVPSEDPLIHLDASRRRGVLVTDALSHWLADLEALGPKLPSLGDRSWRVEVFDRRVGFLGEYRKSRVTGRWFRGKHSIHEQGF